MTLPRFTPTPEGAATPAMLEAYARDGFLILDGFKSGQDCQRLRERTFELVAGFEPESVRSVFEAGGSQRHAADAYFQGSGDRIRFFFKAGAFDATPAPLHG